MSSNNNNGSDQVALLSAQYVNDYLDIVQNLPDELQRYVTNLWEIDVKYQEILSELDTHWETLMSCNNDPAIRRRTLLQAQNSMIRAQELGDNKLQLWTIIQDMVDGKARLLDTNFKKLDIGRENEILHDNSKSESQPERKRIRRHRQVELVPEEKIRAKHEKDVLTSSPCKKQKKTRRKSKMEKEPTEISYEPSIDPNEPTYCFCNRVSFGDMICCDNQKCAWEWFHFECVELNFKPKGKWFCPECRGERSNQMKANLY